MLQFVLQNYTSNDDIFYFLHVHETIKHFLGSVKNSNMTWFLSPIKSTDTNCALLADKSRFPIQPVVTGFFFPKIGSVVCFWCPLGKVGSSLDERRGDKFDRSMTRGKLLDNNTQLFIFISQI